MMIPLAADLKQEIAFLREMELAAVNAPNPDASEVQVITLLDQISFEIEIARRERRRARTSVDIPFNSREKHNPSMVLLRQFLVARGYAMTINSDTITVSWT